MKRYGKTKRKIRRIRRKIRRIGKRKQPLRSQRYTKARLDQVFPLTGPGNPTPQRIGFAWMQREAIISNVYGHNGCARYDQLVRDFEQYAITGMRVTWIPGNVRATFAPDLNNQVGGHIGPMFIYDDINSYNTLSYTDEQILTRDNLMIRDPTRKWSKYLTFRNLSVKMQQKWIDYETLPAVGAYPVLNGSTAISFTTQGINDTTKIGYFRVSWYLTFRGQKR